jgi:shikimate dehydrogenase
MAAHNGRAKLVGVIGDPISHSLSPAIHEYWLQKYGINGAYVPLRIKEERFEQTLEMLLDMGFVGFNVTMPHKERAFAFASTHDTAAKICCAANTLVLQLNGNVHAMNSDVFGFVKMMEYIEQIQPLNKESVLLLGAGGAARAIVLALQMLEVNQVVVANRTLARAEELVAQLQPYYLNTKLVACEMAAAGDYAASAGVVINSLAIDSNASEIITDIVKKSHKEAWIADVSYGKGGTETTRIATEVGRKNIDGLTMLLWQAVSGFEQWFGITPEVDSGLVTCVKEAIK